MKDNLLETKKKKQDSEKTINYYDNIKYHERARDFALRLKSRRFPKIRETISHEGGVLEVGCSTSVYSNDFDDWVGLDISKAALALNKGKNVVQASALRFPFKENCFSLVLMFNLLEHLPNPELALLETVTVLRPGGFVAIGGPPLIWELLVSGESSNYARKKRGVGQVFAGGALSAALLAAVLRRTVPILKEFSRRLEDEILIAIGRKMLPLRPFFLKPDFNNLGEDYDAVYAYNPNAVVNFLRSRGFKIVDLRPIPIRIIHHPTPDVEIILARKFR